MASGRVPKTVNTFNMFGIPWLFNGGGAPTHGGKRTRPLIGRASQVL
jgi:hypothetical protein